MSELPDGWVRTTLDQVCDILDNKRVPINAKERSVRTGNIPYYGATGQVGTIDDYLFNEELVLLGEDGAPFFDKTKQISYIISGKSWVNNHAHVLRAASDICSNRFIKEYLQFFDFTGFVGGSTRLKLTQGKLREIPILLPPKKEQDRIVAKLDSIFSELNKAKTRLNRVPELLKKFRQSVLDAACTGKLTEDWRESNSGVETAKNMLQIIRQKAEMLAKDKKIKKSKIKRTIAQEDIPFKLPTGWVWTRLGELISDGPTNGIYLPQSQYGDGFPILRIDDFQNEWCKKSGELRKVTASKEKIKRYSLEMNNIVINRVNSLSHLGKSTVVKKENLPSLFESNMMALRVFDEINSEFISFWLQSSIGRHLLTKEAKHAVNQASINQTDVASTLIPLAPRLEQIEITERMNKLINQATDNLKAFSIAMSKIEVLESSILKQAFEGRLVEQDPADEPASVLLKRITAERTAPTPKKKPTKKSGADSSSDPSSGGYALAANKA